MVTQWPRQKAQWLSQRGLSWPWTALTRPHIQMSIFSGTSSISTKLLNSSWRARWQSKSQRGKVFRPLLFRVTAPSTCRNGQCKHQTRLCTTVLWVTQGCRGSWAQTQSADGALAVGSPARGCCFSLQWALLEKLSKHFQVCSSEPRTYEFLGCSTERNLQWDSAKRNLRAFLQKCLFSAHRHPLR